jgi:ABC-type molybdate transport system ATPase subunit
MNVFRSIVAVLGFGCLVVGFIAALSGGGPVQHVVALGNTLLTTGAIIIAGVLISSAILERNKKE